MDLALTGHKIAETKQSSAKTMGKTGLHLVQISILGQDIFHSPFPCKHQVIVCRRICSVCSQDHSVVQRSLDTQLLQTHCWQLY